MFQDSGVRIVGGLSKVGVIAKDAVDERILMEMIWANNRSNQNSSSSSSSNSNNNNTNNSN